MISPTAEGIIKAYFEGGNAKDKGSGDIKDIIKVITDVVNEKNKERDKEE